MTLIALATDLPTSVRVTLLDLVRAVAEITQDESEIVATIQYMVSSGRVRLLGEFATEEIVAGC